MMISDSDDDSLNVNDKDDKDNTIDTGSHAHRACSRIH